MWQVKRKQIHIYIGRASIGSLVPVLNSCYRYNLAATLYILFLSPAGRGSGNVGMHEYGFAVHHTLCETCRYHGTGGSQTTPVPFLFVTQVEYLQVKLCCQPQTKRKISLFKGLVMSNYHVVIVGLDFRTSVIKCGTKCSILQLSWPNSYEGLGHVI